MPQEKKVRLIGYVTEASSQRPGVSRVDFKEESVATFDNSKLAKAYVAASRRKKPITGRWHSDYNFKRKSLLSPYSYVEIEEIEDSSVPHNPEIK